MGSCVKCLLVLGEFSKVHRNVEDASDAYRCRSEFTGFYVPRSFLTENLNFFRIRPINAVGRILVSNWVPKPGTAFVQAIVVLETSTGMDVCTFFDQS